MELPSETLVIKRVQLDALVEGVKEIKQMLTRGTIDAKLDVLCKGDMVTSKVVKQLMGWSETTFQRRLNCPKKPIPMTKDGSRWVMTRKQFIDYYEIVTGTK